MPDIAPPRPDSLLGGRYRLVRRCGIGGMGEVWEAEDSVLERRVAVKLVTSDHRHDPAVLARFEREARTGARLVHPNLATVYDYGEADEGAYLVMELLAGETLAERLRRGPLPPTEAAVVVAEAAEALAVAHAAGVTHRDVKPSNLMLTGHGTKVMDFGIASGEGEPLTATGLVIGTADYLAPERARGQTSGPAADVYALGAVLVEAITGERAFRGETPADVARAQVHAEPPDLRPMADVPTHIADAASAALAKDPTARPSAVTLAARLRDPGASAVGATTVAVASASAPTTTFPPVEQPRVGPPAGRATRSSGPGPWLIVLGVLLLLAVAAGAGLLLTDDGEESDRPQAPAASTAPAVIATTTPTVVTTVPPAPTAAPPTTTTPPPTTTPPLSAPEPSDEALAGAAVTYIETVAAGDFDTAWALTSPEFQATQDRASWEGFWSSFDTIELDGDPRVKGRDARVELPLRFDGRNERYRIDFVPGPDGTWLVDGPVGR